MSIYDQENHPLLKIPLINRVSLFACRNVVDSFKFGTRITKTWCEAIFEFQNSGIGYLMENFSRLVAEKIQNNLEIRAAYESEQKRVKQRNAIQSQLYNAASQAPYLSRTQLDALNLSLSNLEDPIPIPAAIHPQISPYKDDFSEILGRILYRDSVWCFDLFVTFNPRLKHLLFEDFLNEEVRARLWCGGCPCSLPCFASKNTFDLSKWPLLHAACFAGAKKVVASMLNHLQQYAAATAAEKNDPSLELAIISNCVNAGLPPTAVYVLGLVRPTGARNRGKSDTLVQNSLPAFTPLQLACIKQHTAIVDFLLRRSKNQVNVFASTLTRKGKNTWQDAFEMLACECSMTGVDGDEEKSSSARLGCIKHIFKYLETVLSDAKKEEHEHKNAKAKNQNGNDDDDCDDDDDDCDDDNGDDCAVLLLPPAQLLRADIHKQCEDRFKNFIDKNLSFLCFAIRRGDVELIKLILARFEIFLYYFEPRLTLGMHNNTGVVSPFSYLQTVSFLPAPTFQEYAKIMTGGRNDNAEDLLMVAADDEEDEEGQESEQRRNQNGNDDDEEDEKDKTNGNDDEKNENDESGAKKQQPLAAGEASASSNSKKSLLSRQHFSKNPAAKSESVWATNPLLTALKANKSDIFVLLINAKNFLNLDGEPFCSAVPALSEPHRRMVDKVNGLTKLIGGIDDFITPTPLMFLLQSKLCNAGGTAETVIKKLLDPFLLVGGTSTLVKSMYFSNNNNNNNSNNNINDDQSSSTNNNVQYVTPLEFVNFSLSIHPTAREKVREAAAKHKKPAQNYNKNASNKEENYHEKNYGDEGAAKKGNNNSNAKGKTNSKDNNKNAQAKKKK